MNSEPGPPPATARLPIVTATNGHAYLGCDAVVALLRGIAYAARAVADDPDCDLQTLADTIDAEADALDCRAIAHTT